MSGQKLLCFVLFIVAIYLLITMFIDTSRHTNLVPSLLDSRNSNFTVNQTIDISSHSEGFNTIQIGDTVSTGGTKLSDYRNDPSFLEEQPFLSRRDGQLSDSDDFLNELERHSIPLNANQHNRPLKRSSYDNSLSAFCAKSENSVKCYGYQLPSISTLIDLLRNEFVDSQYRFNVPNQPVTTTRSNIDTKYLRQIENNITKWNRVFQKYYSTYDEHITLSELVPVFIMETEREFIIQINVALMYRSKSFHLQLLYYGTVMKSDTFLNDCLIPDETNDTTLELSIYRRQFGLVPKTTDFATEVCSVDTDVYVLQLLDMVPMKKSDFDKIKIDILHDSDKPFMTLDEQLEYVKQQDAIRRTEK